MDPSPSGSQPPQKAVPKLATVGWRTMLIFNLGLAAYIFAKKRERDIDAGEKMGVKKGGEARTKGVKKGVVNTEVEKKGAENSAVADTDEAKKPETAMPEKEEAKPITKPDPLFEFIDAADQLVFQTAATEPVKVEQGNRFQKTSKGSSSSGSWKRRGR